MLYSRDVSRKGSECWSRPIYYEFITLVTNYTTNLAIANKILEN